MQFLGGINMSDITKISLFFGAKYGKSVGHRKRVIWLKLEDMLRDKGDELEAMNERLSEAQEYQKDNKKYRRKIADLEDEIAQFEQMRETYQKVFQKNK